MPSLHETVGISITFCIITMQKTRWLRNTLIAIRQHCPIAYNVRLLVVGNPDVELSELLKEFSEVLTTTISSVNLGCGGGRELLTREVETDFTMMLDDDMYLTAGAIEHALTVFNEHKEIGAIGFPSSNLKGQISSLGGRRLVVRGRVISRFTPKLDDQDFAEVEDLDGGAMLLRSEMLKDFLWDGRYIGGFDDIDKSLQIINGTRWKQAILPKERLIHDRSWVSEGAEYASLRLDGLQARKSYLMFRKKWKLRFDIRDHVYFELIFPLMTLIPWRNPRIAFDKFLREKRGTRRRS